jgi:hypothetical protein
MRPRTKFLTREQAEMVIARLLRFKLYKWSRGIA